MSAIHRRQRNLITGLQDSNNVWVSSEPQLQHMARNYFMDIFNNTNSSTNSNLPFQMPQIITEEMNKDICRDITDDEIHNAVFNLGAKQSTGPEGYPGHFYRRYWNLVQDKFCLEVKEFFRSYNMT
ncbi:hypothetical protein LINPERHAP1_LOCUS5533 [Linum perenne]